MSVNATLDVRRLADCDNGASLSNRMRSRRFELFERLTSPLPRPLTILDIGGTNEFWAQRGWAGRDDVTITTVNLDEEPQVHPNIHPRVADATNLAEFDDQSFDIAFSNSVIEHLFTREAQEAMARETRRVARSYWIQTPNYWFPMEPHFLVPGWQWLPETARVAAIRRRRLGWRGPVRDPEEARKSVREIRLMRRSELARLFPGATLRPERFGGLVKSWIVLGGSLAKC
jgi:Methyltransferase domain